MIAFKRKITGFAQLRSRLPASNKLILKDNQKICRACFQNLDRSVIDQIERINSFKVKRKLKRV
jgi:hypothetical protein